MNRLTAFRERLGRLFRGARYLCIEVIRRSKKWYKTTDGSYLLFCFLLPFALMALIYAVIGVWPFGRGSVLVLDLNGQYVYFFEALRDLVWGDSSLLYSFSRALGGEFLGIYAYYLASPLSWLVALFPADSILEALLFMLLIKQGLSGLSFGYYLRKTTALSPRATILFSAVYSLTAYGVVMQHNTMWTDNVILLPLLALGIRALVCHGRYKLYTVTLTLAIISNFYIGYMACLFAVLYFFYLQLALPRSERNPSGRRLNLLRTGGRFAAFSLIAGAISAIIVIPAVYALSFGKNTFSTPTYEFISKVDLFDILTKLLFGSYDTVRPEGLPCLYCGVITLLLLPFYFASRRISTREKAAGGLLALALLFSFSISVIDMVWHGGQAPNWLNYRYSYMLTFLLIEMAAKGYHGIRDYRPHHVALTALPLLVFVILADYFDYGSVDVAIFKKFGNGHLDGIFMPGLANLLWIGLYVALLSFIIRRRDILIKHATRWLMLAVSVELFLAGLLNVIQLHMDVVISSRDSYLDYKARWEEAFRTVEEIEDAPFYRAEKLNYRKVNDPFLFGYRGLSGSTSTLNRETIAFLHAMGYNSVSHASCYDGTNPFSDSFLSVSYVAGEATSVFPARYQRVYDNGDVVVYRNPDALPIAFGASAVMDTVTFERYVMSKDGKLIEREDGKTVYDHASPFERMNALASALLGEEITLFTPLATPTPSCENVSHVRTTGRFKRIDDGRDGYVSYTLKISKNSEIYAYFPAYFPQDASTKGFDYLLNGETVGRLMKGEASGYLCLGSYAAGETCRVTFRLDGGPLYLRRTMPYFYSFDAEAYGRLIQALSAGGLSVTECREDYFEGHIEVQEGFETVLTTIPYDKGWRVTVDGEEIETYKSLDALLAFDLSPGRHTVTMRYMPQEYVWAFLISLSGIAVFSAVLLTEFLVKRHKEQKAATAAGKDTESCSTTSEET